MGDRWGEDHVFDSSSCRDGGAARDDLMLRRIQHGSGARKAQSKTPTSPTPRGPTCAASSCWPPRTTPASARKKAPPTSETKRKRKNPLTTRPSRRGSPPPRSERSGARLASLHRHVVGRRVYDSELGVTCHWCRQKTTDPRVRCSSEIVRRVRVVGKDGRASRAIALPPSPCSEAACATDTARTSTAPPRPTHGSARSAEVRAARDVAVLQQGPCRKTGPPAPRPRDPEGGQASGVR